MNTELTRNHVIIPCARTRGKVISFVVVSTKITRSRDIGILVSGQYCQDVIIDESCFEVLDKDHEWYKLNSDFVTAMPITHTQYAIIVCTFHCTWSNW